MTRSYLAISAAAGAVFYALYWAAPYAFVVLFTVRF